MEFAITARKADNSYENLLNTERLDRNEQFPGFLEFETSHTSS
jgi:hypothetical protein